MVRNKFHENVPGQFVLETGIQEKKDNDDGNNIQQKAADKDVLLHNKQ